MSGGVDSSVAAALAVDKYGQENVFGLTMRLFCYGEKGTTDKSCCSLDAINDAATVCKQIGIPHYVVNLEKEFETDIIDNFIFEYEHGRTPNPCVRCNSLIKFQHLLTKTKSLGANILVTGHYARVVHNENSYQLLRGIDKTKDQSYFLYNLNQEQLSQIWFPLGESTKSETRIMAKKYGLRTAGKSESQDICFISTTTQDFLSDKVKAKPGDIVNKTGEVLGKHEGLSYYTVGQRKGLGGGFTEPMYATRLNLVDNELVVGREKELYASEMAVGEVSWVCEASSLQLPVELDVRIRYNSEATTATLQAVIPAKAGIQKIDAESLDSRLRGNDVGISVNIKFHEPQKAITPGQTAVFYDGDRVVGGGTIVASL
jgi:tRNA-specific 2-thiouridylase